MTANINQLLRVLSVSGLETSDGNDLSNWFFSAQLDGHCSTRNTLQMSFSTMLLITSLKLYCINPLRHWHAPNSCSTNKNVDENFIDLLYFLMSPDMLLKPHNTQCLTYISLFLWYFKDISDTSKVIFYRSNLESYLQLSLWFNIWCLVPYTEMGIH